MPKDESQQPRTPLPPIIQPQQGDPPPPKKPDDFVDEMVKGIRRVRSEYVVNKMTKDMMGDAPLPPSPAHDPPIKMSFDVGAFMSNALKQGSDLSKLLQDEHKATVDSLLSRMEELRQRAERPQQEAPDVFKLFLQFRALNNELVKEARDAVGSAAVAAPQGVPDIAHLVELKKIDVQLAEGQRKHEVALQEMRQRHDIEMKRLDLQIRNDDRKLNFEESKFKTEIEMKREESRSSQAVRQEAIAGFQDLVSGFAAGVDREMEGAGAAGKAAVASRLAARKIKESIPCPKQGCTGTLTLPPDLQAGQGVTCPTCNETFTAEAGA